MYTFCFFHYSASTNDEPDVRIDLDSHTTISGKDFTQTTQNAMENLATPIDFSGPDFKQLLDIS